jgi:hypothetical protein
MKSTVLKFIDEFTGKGNKEQVIDCFMNGCCYWFAHILAHRFHDLECIRTRCIMYAPVENHFGCVVEDGIYDITGDVTDKYEWVEWPAFAKKEPNVAANITRACIRKEPVKWE